MNLFDVYPLFNIEIVQGKGCHVWDSEGNEYLDLYGGHAVISVGHSHPTYVKAITEQVNKLGFYSNSVINSLQQKLADKLGKASGYDDYSLFLINSGAEANENALKLASFHNGKKRVIAFKHAFHGRTSAAVRVTDNPKIIAPVNEDLAVTYLPLNDAAAVETELQKETFPRLSSKAFKVWVVSSCRPTPLCRNCAFYVQNMKLALSLTKSSRATDVAANSSLTSMPESGRT